MSELEQLIEDQGRDDRSWRVSSISADPMLDRVVAGEGALAVLISDHRRGLFRIPVVEQPQCQGFIDLGPKWSGIVRCSFRSRHDSLYCRNHDPRFTIPRGRRRETARKWQIRRTARRLAAGETVTLQADKTGNARSILYEAAVRLGKTAETWMEEPGVVSGRLAAF